MQLIFDATNPVAGEQTMTKGQDRAEVIDIHALQERDTDLVLARRCDGRRRSRPNTEPDIDPAAPGQF